MAKAWFALLQKMNEEQVKALKKQLCKKTLVGEYCNMQNMQHLVHYGQEAQLLFYALVEKDNNEDDCLPLSSTFKFLEQFNLPSVKKEIKPAKTVEEVMYKLKEIVIDIN